ncbi:MAG: hypothetical protein HFG00_02900 [Oscillibacter sp.]|nr:hypothetical protein [Oscillibacter sp.]
MTVREHMAAAGYNLASAWEPESIRPEAGTMECERVEIKTFRCRPTCYEEMLGVKATAITRYSDGCERPYPDGWPGSMAASITAYFHIEKEAS